MFLRAAAFRAKAFAARFFGGLIGDEPPVDPPVEPPVQETPSIFTGGVGGIRRELSEEDRKRLLKRIRKSLGLDKDPEPARQTMQGVSFSAIVVDALPDLDRSAAARRRARRLDDEDVILLTTGVL